MKILEIIATLDPGGAETLACELAIDFARRGAQIKLFLLAGVRNQRGEFLRDRLENIGIEVIGSEPRRPASAKNLLTLINILSNWRPDIAHCHLFNSEIPLALSRLIIGRKASTYVRTLHSSIPEFKLPRIFFKFFCSFFDYNIACSHAVEKSYLFTFGESSKEKLTIIPNGCYLAESYTSAKEKRQARLQLAIATEDFVFCNIGAFRGSSLSTEQKAHDILMKVFAEAFRERDNVLLVCAGDGPLKEGAQALASGLGIKNKVLFYGNIPEIWPLLRASDVFVMPSRFEGLPISILEAASTGLPVIASDIPEISILKPGDSWILCPLDNLAYFAETMIKMKNDISKYRHFARQESKIIRDRYSITVCSQKYWDLFNSSPSTLQL